VQRVKTFRVGDVAAATGVTVRTLHHYDEIGLLVPSARSQAGHRLYGDADLRRLYRILALRGMGMPLSEIAATLDREGEARARHCAGISPGSTRSSVSARSSGASSGTSCAFWTTPGRRRAARSSRRSR
jgi:DNA-binding transcriptional MerR regulator